ncbi:MAG: FMN-binding protein [Clostridia bacterium]|nr:FMN-binding protein [Clostridia bacterium]
MKKIFKVLSLLAISAVVCLGIVAFAACSKDSGTTYEGEYQYTSNGNNYGIKVAVTVDDKETVTKVAILDSDYVEVTPALPQYGWEQSNVDNWNNNINTLLGKYTGKTVVELLAIEVEVEDSVPVDGQTFDGLVITGATQGSGRLLLAVQNALSKCPVTYTGEYHYNSNGNEYGIKVSVVVTGGKITKVSILDSDYVEVTSALPQYGWEQSNVDNWNNNIDNLLAQYNGKSVSDILAINVEVEDSVPADGQTFGGLVISGATQGSGRLLLAVQNALK